MMFNTKFNTQTIELKKHVRLVFYFLVMLTLSLPSACKDKARSIPPPAASLLKEQSTADLDRQVRKTILLTLLPVIVAFSFFFFIFYRARRESFFKQQEMAFRLGMSELELKALRAQMNPHFIFNCLNSIHHYMQSNDVRLAGDYLVKFSQLIRYVLETSSFRMIPLADDLDALRAYVELEQLRMQHSFQFKIHVNEIPDPQTIFIPPMMIQPFVENSIWHGLSQRGDGGLIELRLSINNALLYCIVEDNGNTKKGHMVHTVPGVKKTSMGMALINERVAAVNTIFKANAEFKVEHRSNDMPPAEGRRIILTLPFEQD